MEDDDDEKYFELIVYGQGESNQYAKMQARLALLCKQRNTGTCLCKITPNSRMPTPINWAMASSLDKTDACLLSLERLCRWPASESFPIFSGSE